MMFELFPAADVRGNAEGELHTCRLMQLLTASSDHHSRDSTWAHPRKLLRLFALLGHQSQTFQIQDIYIYIYMPKCAAPKQQPCLLLSLYIIVVACCNCVFV